MPALDFEIVDLPDWITIYGLDTTMIDGGHSGDQVERAASALCGTSGWRIVFGHHGLHTVGKHGDRSGTIQTMNLALLAPLIQKCGVHVVFAGHDHLQAHISAPDFEQITQAAGGRSLHATQERKVRPIEVELVEVRDDDFGFAVVEVDAEMLRVSFFSLRDAGGPFYCAQFSIESFDQRPRHAACNAASNAPAP